MRCAPACSPTCRGPGGGLLTAVTASRTNGRRAQRMSGECVRTLSGGIASGGKRRTHLIHPRVRNLRSARHRVCFVKVSTDRSYARLRSTGVEWTRNLFSRSGTSWRRSAPLASRMTRPRWRLPAGLRALAGTTKGMDLQRRCRCSRWAPEPTVGEIVIDDADLAAGRADRGGARALPRGIASPVPRRSGGSPCGREDPDSAAAAAPAAPATPPLPPGRQDPNPDPPSVRKTIYEPPPDRSGGLGRPRTRG